ncbi:MAG: hypothetical protein ABI557_06165 [Aureliella sp.]
MSQPSQQIAARYQLRLSEAWRQWFDEDVARVRLPGGFRAALTAEQLIRPAPREIWPGFMLPYTLPLVGNQYGDWICVCIETDGSLGELLHWYHGGGDWIPLGNDIAEVVVHDVIDHFRPVGGQMLRGAPESIEPEQRAQVLSAFQEAGLRNWLCERLSASAKDQPISADEVARELANIEQALEAGAYMDALQVMQQRSWAMDAVACDRIQYVLQHGTVQLSDPAIAHALNIKWSPDYVRWLFDVDRIPQSVRARVAELSRARAERRDDGDLWDQQDWTLAGKLACEVLERRNDLGWAVNVAGWSRQRVGNAAEAADIYFQGRYASAFSDQAVRMRTHWTESSYGKFTIAQLFELRDYLTPDQQADPYLRAIVHSEGRTVEQVQNFWLNKSRRLSNEQTFDDANCCLVRAGWDLGVEHLGDYRSILEPLIASARSAGWEARQAVAQTHLNCFLRGGSH